MKNPVEKLHIPIVCLCVRGMKLPPRLPLVSDEIAGPEKVRGVSTEHKIEDVLLLHHFLQ